jgi:hypothetical protein
MKGKTMKKIIALMLCMPALIGAMGAPVNPAEYTIEPYAKKLEKTLEEALFKRYPNQAKRSSFYDKFKASKSDITALVGQLKSDNTPENRAVSLYIIWQYISAWAFTGGTSRPSSEKLAVLKKLFDKSIVQVADSDPIKMLLHIIPLSMQSLKKANQESSQSFKILSDMLETIEETYPELAAAKRKEEPAVFKGV